MFSLMDKVPNGIEPMLKDLEEHIMSAGLADMVASAETITSVSVAQTNMPNWWWWEVCKNRLQVITVCINIEMHFNDSSNCRGAVILINHNASLVMIQRCVANDGLILWWDNLDGGGGISATTVCHRANKEHVRFFFFFTKHFPHFTPPHFYDNNSI